MAKKRLLVLSVAFAVATLIGLSFDETTDDRPMEYAVAENSAREADAEENDRAHAVSVSKPPLMRADIGKNCFDQLPSVVLTATKGFASSCAKVKSSGLCESVSRERDHSRCGARRAARAAPADPPCAAPVGSRAGEVLRDVQGARQRPGLARGELQRGGTACCCCCSS